jgi:radical SAM superfamily enzyme YgiQ (UPF0313 family)
LKFLFVDLAVYHHRLREPFRRTDHLRRVAATLVTQSVTQTILPSGKVAFSRGLLNIASLLKTAGASVAYHHFNEEPRDTLLQLAADSDVLCLYAMTPTIGKCLHLATDVKNTNPKCIVAIGGPHTTATRRELLETGVVDFVPSPGARAKDSIAELLNRIRHLRPHQCDLSFPLAPESIPPRPYLDVIDYSILPHSPGAYYFNISTTSGCYYDCNFCSDGWRPVRFCQGKVRSSSS